MAVLEVFAILPGEAIAEVCATATEEESIRSLPAEEIVAVSEASSQKRAAGRAAGVSRAELPFHTAREWARIQESGLATAAVARPRVRRPGEFRADATLPVFRTTNDQRGGDLASATRTEWSM